jgi:hypothetical protein
VDSEKTDEQLEPMHGRRRVTLLDRINNFFGHFIGAAGKRRGARDTDPGR